MAQDTPDNGEPRKEGQKLYLWSRSANAPLGESSSSSEETTTTTAAAPGTAPSPNTPKLSPTEFQSNFPPQEGGSAKGYPSIGEAVKSIKWEDFLNITQIPCARDGFLTGIASGAGVGGLRYVWRGTPIKAAHWAVGGFMAGCTVAFEYCQYKRRQERIRMKRTVEVYQETLVEKKRRELEQLKQEHEKKAEEEATKAAQKSWYKFW
ncbi:Cytochrome c oxidase protein 20, mitochondrial [Colletotrichum chlorophyti]|uniref:Cytochrome c oxidase assembly protein COX20, mitochondrial n=1 Tax=Colletotrichum chlorophyti TaxID=708187 RepID=A0A1Q8S478_9PEZI|nr:Cytochrome c oxidase protein 20, mitochondrial [Colletotrichum chlorophyti]